MRLEICCCCCFCSCSSCSAPQPAYSTVKFSSQDGIYALGDLLLLLFLLLFLMFSSPTSVFYSYVQLSRWDLCTWRSVVVVVVVVFALVPHVQLPNQRILQLSSALKMGSMRLEICCCCCCCFCSCSSCSAPQPAYSTVKFSSQDGIYALGDLLLLLLLLLFLLLFLMFSSPTSVFYS